MPSRRSRVRENEGVRSCCAGRIGRHPRHNTSRRDPNHAHIRPMPSPSTHKTSGIVLRKECETITLPSPSRSRSALSVCLCTPAKPYARFPPPRQDVAALPPTHLLRPLGRPLLLTDLAVCPAIASPRTRWSCASREREIARRGIARLVVPKLRPGYSSTGVGRRPAARDHHVSRLPGGGTRGPQSRAIPGCRPSYRQGEPKGSK